MAQVDTQNSQTNTTDQLLPNGQPNPNFNQATNQPTPPATSSGAGPVTATGAANVTGQVVGTNNPTQPFQNISSYLAANAPQSEALAGNIAGTVSGATSQATNDIANASQTFENSVNAGYTPEMSSTDLTNIVSNPVAATTPVNGATNPDIAAFQAQLGDTYTGPTDFSTVPNYANLETEIANAQSLGTTAQTPTGIQTLLQTTEAPDYTQGINNLDSLLLTQDPTNLQTIENAGLPSQGLSDYLNTQTTNANALAAGAPALADTANQNANNTLTTMEQGYAKSLADKLASDQAKYTADVAAESPYQQPLLNIPITALTGSSIDPKLIDALANITSFNSAVPTAYDLNPGEGAGALNALPLNPNSISDVSSQSDIDLGNALATLSGGSYASPVSSVGGFNENWAPTVNQSQLANQLYTALIYNPGGKEAFAGFGAPDLLGFASYAKALTDLQEYLGLPVETLP